MRAAAGTRAWLFWTVSAVAAGLLAFGAGASGLLGNPEGAEDFPTVIVAPVVGTALLDCPGGRPLSVVPRNERLYVVGRTEDTTWLAVRSPQLGYRTVWLPAVHLVADEFPVPLADLPVRECDPPEVGP